MIVKSQIREVHVKQGAAVDNDKKSQQTAGIQEYGIHQHHILVLGESHAFSVAFSFVLGFRIKGSKDQACLVNSQHAKDFSLLFLY